MSSLSSTRAFFSRMNLDYLLSTLAEAAENESNNIADALAHEQADARKKLKELANNASKQEGWMLKGRLAVVALHLGDSSVAVDVNKPDHPDPTQQTVFIHDVFPTWHGDLGRLATVMNVAVDAGLRHGMCLAMGKVPDLGDAQKQWHDLMSRWHQQQPDSGTHGASEWALNQRKGAVPKQSEKAGGSDWHVTEHGITLIRVPAGSFERTDEFARPPVKQLVTLSEFWLSDREVSVELFQQFIDDEEYEGPKPNEKWEGVNERASPTAQHPVQQVSWEDAVLFCNWLTAQQNGLTPYCAVKELANPAEPQTWEVEILSNGTGYRLPTAQALCYEIVVGR